MSQVKLLNLDELAAIKREVQIKGKSYEVAEQTIGEMIARLQLSKQVEGSDSPESFLTTMRDTAQNILPKAPKSVINGLSMKQITALIEFINDRDLDETAKEMQQAEKTEQAESADKPVKGDGKKS